MKLTPLEIRKQEFRKGLRGFDPIEVQTFLDMVSEQYEELLEENKKLNHKIVELDAKLSNYQDNEKNLRETLLNVQEVKKQSEESSRRQADLITKEAELKALEILENARKQARQIREEISWLRSQKESFINRLRHILVSQIELLSVMEIDDILPEDEQAKIRSWKSRKFSQAEMDAEAEIETKSASKKPDAEASEKSEKKSSKPAAKTKKKKDDDASERIIQQYTEEEKAEKKDDKLASSPSEPSLSEEEINDFFKKGIQIDDLIKTINKKDFDK